jgi:hypothetical protein
MDEGLRPRRAARTEGQRGSEVARLERGPLADDHWASRMHAEAVETPDDLRHDSENVSVDDAYHTTTVAKEFVHVHG